MCTVTFLNLKDGFVLTASRDERRNRPTLATAAYLHGGIQWYYPKDAEAGGTWIVAGENKARCLLNGAFDSHLPPTRSYSRSRGSVVLESLTNTPEEVFVNSVDLSGVEPFTLLLLDYTQDLQLLEFRWDGQQKFAKEMDVMQPHIWSSATLYSVGNRAARTIWFQQWCEANAVKGTPVLDFHAGTHSPDPRQNILMKREGGLQTVSISQVVRRNKNTYVNYWDLINDTNSQIAVKPQTLAIHV